MVKKNTNIRNKSKVGLDNLYMSFSNSNEKRKSLLYGIKNSLIMQDEYEKILKLRKEKSPILFEIKKNMNSINLSYQNLKKLLPNVKNILSYTEKELGLIDEEIRVLKTSVKKDKHRIKDYKNFEDKVEDGVHLMKNKKVRISQKKEEVNKKFEVKNEVKKPLTKLDRIKNNLKVIESKLNNI